MDSLLTLSLGEYSSVEIVLRLTVAIMVMSATLLALSASVVVQSLRFPLILSAVALAGTAWFEVEVWQSWKEAFELAGTSYAVTGQLIADQDRIIAWSLGVPVLLFAFGIAQLSGRKKNSISWQLGVILLFLSLSAPFSRIAALVLLAYAGGLLLITIPRMMPVKAMALEVRLAVAFIFVGLVFSAFCSWHPFSLGGGTSGELVRGEIIRSLIELFSLVLPALLLLIGTLRLSNTHVSDS